MTALASHCRALSRIATWAKIRNPIGGDSSETFKLFFLTDERGKLEFLKTEHEFIAFVFIVKTILNTI